MKSQCPLPPQILKCSIHIQRSIPPRRIRITPVIRPVCAADQHIFDIRRGHENLISFYQLKPIWEESFFRLMDAVLAECEKKKKNSLILRSKDGITRIDLQQLEYCEVLGRKLLFHLENGAVLESAGIWMIWQDS